MNIIEPRQTGMIDYRLADLSLQGACKSGHRYGLSGQLPMHYFYAAFRWWSPLCGRTGCWPGRGWDFMQFGPTLCTLQSVPRHLEGPIVRNKPPESRRSGHECFLIEDGAHCVVANCRCWRG